MVGCTAFANGAPHGSAVSHPGWIRRCGSRRLEYGCATGATHWLLTAPSPVPQCSALPRASAHKQEFDSVAPIQQKGTELGRCPTLCRGGEVVSITSCRSTGSLGHAASFCNILEGREWRKKDPNRKGSFFWHKGRGEAAFWRSWRQAAGLGLGLRTPVAHLCNGHRSRAAPSAPSPRRGVGQAAGPHRGRRQAVLTARSPKGGFLGEGRCVFLRAEIMNPGCCDALTCPHTAQNVPQCWKG